MNNKEIFICEVSIIIIIIIIIISIIILICRKVGSIGPVQQKIKLPSPDPNFGKYP